MGDNNWYRSDVVIGFKSKKTTNGAHITDFGLGTSTTYNGKNTYTIDEDGNVGAIGGVKYKMLGAQKDGADIFFVPKENYDEAKKVYKKNNLSFELVMVETFDEAINYLNNL